MKPRFFSLLSLLLLLLATGGCLRSQYPLSAVKDARPDPRLVGQWRGTEPTPKQAKNAEPAKEEPKTVQISFDEHGMGRAQGVFRDGRLSPDVSYFFVTRTAKHDFINLQGEPHSKEFVFYRYRISANGQTVRVWGFHQELFDAAVKAGKLKGKLNVTPSKKDGTVFGYTLLQTPSDQLLKFIESQPDKETYQELMAAKKVR